MSVTNKELQQDIPEGYQKTEAGVIPADWDIFEFGNLVNYTKGYAFKSADYTTDGVRIIRVSDTTFDSIEDSGAVYISLEGAQKYKKWALGENDLIFSTVGSKPPMYDSLVGKAVIVTGQHEGSLLNQNAVIIRAKKFTEDFQKLLLNHFRTERYIDHIEIIYRGNANQASITLENLFQFKIPLPTDDKEQTAIANALSDVDTLITSLEKLITKKRAIKTAAMQQLLTGKKRLPPFDTLNLKDGKPAYKQTELGEIPEDWEVKSYGQAFNFLTTASNSRSDLHDNGNYQYIHYGDIHVKWDSTVNFSSDQIPKIDSYKVKNANLLKDGDLIMADASEDYDGIGKSVEVAGLGDLDAVSGLHTFLLRDNGVFVDGYRGYLHQIKSTKQSFDRLATGLKVYGLSKGSLKGVLVPVPPKDEQVLITEFLSDMTDEVDLLKQRLNKTQQLKQGMMQELLTGRTRLV